MWERGERKVPISEKKVGKRKKSFSAFLRGWQAERRKKGRSSDYEGGFLTGGRGKGHEKSLF